MALSTIFTIFYCVVLMGGILVFFAYGEFKLYRVRNKIKRIIQSDNILDEILKTEIANIAKEYSATIKINNAEGGQKYEQISQPTNFLTEFESA